MISVLKDLWELLRGAPPPERPQSPLESASVPAWKTEVLVHPNYWVESNFTQIEKLAPFLKGIIDKALREGHIKDITREVAQDSVNLLQETLVIQLRTHISKEEGDWVVRGKDKCIAVKIQMKEDKSWSHATNAWETAKTIVTSSHGVQLHEVEEKWNRSGLTGEVQIPVDKLQLNIDSSLMWTVLYRNRKHPILWKHKLWVPK